MRKSNIFKSLCIFALFVFAGFSAKAQLTHLEQSIYLNFNLPMAQFNDDASYSNGNIPMTRYDIGKEAVAGVGIGYRVSYRFDVGFGEVSPYLNADFQWNRVNSDLRDEYLDADGKIPNYFNLPVFVGVNYRYQLTDVFTPFAEFGIGPDFLLVTKETVPLTNIDLRYKLSCNVAWQIGAGCFFGEHVSAGIHYSGFGKHTIKYTDGTTDTDPVSLADTKTQKRNLGLLSLRIGFHF
ncbi:MAG: hypothetical protein J6X86_07885 [Bacteroidales bacterium]|nr:hypothetical protein [Bacteroidales bacterium]